MHTMRSAYTPMPKTRKYEVNSGKTIVMQSPVVSNGERIAQMEMSGLMIEANRVGYQISADVEIKDQIIPILSNVKSLDITQKIELMRVIRKQMNEFMRKSFDVYQNQQKQATEAKIKAEGINTPEEQKKPVAPSSRVDDAV